MKSRLCLLEGQEGGDFGAKDGLTEYEFEGSGSRCTSLSSLDASSIHSSDWEDTFRALGPKFQHLADMAGGKDDDDEENGKQTQQQTYEFGETEI